MRYLLFLLTFFFSSSLCADVTYSGSPSTGSVSTSSTTTTKQEADVFGDDNFIDQSNTEIQETNINQGIINHGTYVDGALDDSVDVNQTVIIDQPSEILDIHVDATKTRKFLTIDPRTLAQDLEEAFTQIIRFDAKAKIYAVINGRSIDRIVDVKAMEHGTLVVIAYKSGRKIKHYAVKPEDVDELGQR